MSLRICELVRGRVFLAGLVLLALYAVAAVFVPARLLIEIGDAVSIPISLFASISYAINFFGRARGRSEYIDYVIFAISGAWAINAVDRAIRLAARLDPDLSLIDSPLLGALLFGLSYFAALHLLALHSGRMHKSYGLPSLGGWDAIGVALLIGLCFAGFVVAWHLMR